VTILASKKTMWMNDDDELILAYSTIVFDYTKNLSLRFVFFFSEFVGFNFNFWRKVHGERKIIIMCKKLRCVIFFFKFLVMCNFFRV